MATKFKHLRLDRGAFLFSREHFPCQPLFLIAHEAMMMFLPRVDVLTLKPILGKLVREPKLAAIVAGAEALVHDLESGLGPQRHRELEEAVKFIDATIRKGLKKGMRTSPADDFCLCATLHKEETRESINLRLTTGRTLGQLELAAAAALINCELCIEACLANDAYGVAVLMAGIHRCSQQFYDHRVAESRRVEASGRGRKSHENSDKQNAMDEIKAEFCKWKGKDAQFARKMMEKYGDVLDNEGSIKNACKRWRDEAKNHPASKMSSC